MNGFVDLSRQFRRFIGGALLGIWIDFGEVFVDVVVDTWLSGSISVSEWAVL